MKHQLLVVAAVWVAWVPASGQSVSRDARFEVASVKECKSTDHVPPSNWSPGRVSLTCWPLMRLIQDAYEVYASGKVNPANPIFPLTPIEGLPDWARSASYGIDAKAADGQAPAMMRGPLMQTLLEDRFHLRVHREIREVPVYILTVDKGGSKLRHTADGSCDHVDPTELTQPDRGGKPLCIVTPPVRNGTATVYDVRGITLDVFSKLLRLGRPVLDRTGLTGAFDIHLEWEPDSPNTPAADDAPAVASPHMSAIEAMRKQLGLRLDPGKGPSEFLVIDHVERPSGN